MPADTHLATEIEAINQVLADADTLGSIMKFRLSPAAREWVASLEEENEAAQLVLALTEQYHALVMNPPYMGGGNMNATLSNYVKKNYEAGKADLFSVFMQVCEERLMADGKYGMINMQSWMFLSSFEKLRTHLLDTMQIDNMLHLGPRTFDELSGEVVQNTAFVLTKQGTRNGCSWPGRTAIPTSPNKTSRRFRDARLGIGFHPRFKRCLHQISRCQQFAAQHRGWQLLTTRDFSAFGSRSAKAESALAAKMPRQRLDRKKNGFHIIKEEIKDDGMETNLT